MESYSISYSSSNKSSYISKSTKKTNGGSMNHDQYPIQSKKYSWLHSVRKSPAKTWNKKAPIAPMAPTPPKVYRVDPINFKELVQSLTCAPEFLPQQFLQTTDLNTVRDSIVPSLQEEVSTPQPPLVLPLNTTNSRYQYFENEYFGKNSHEDDEEIMTRGLIEMNMLSPTCYGNWCFVPPIITPRA